MHKIALCLKRENKKTETLKSSKTDNMVTKHVSEVNTIAPNNVSVEQYKIKSTVYNHVNNGENRILIHTFGSKVPTQIKCARMQVKIRDILDKDEIKIEALEINKVSSAPLEFTPIDIINELKIEGISLCDIDYDVLGRKVFLYLLE
ncbi:hypothetical protein NPIL_627211 [Nephila pilipes]|uniref:Uncharacterized protein n=1 Tax=Nephila pilipes TaxID=299642 RepID=A0A8X6TCJ7_NEPPI|nr:hypothetical protein NPIL_627211 [Nephila pilipes]